MPAHAPTTISVECPRLIGNRLLRRQLGQAAPKPLKSVKLHHRWFRKISRGSFGNPKFSRGSAGVCVLGSADAYSEMPVVRNGQSCKVAFGPGGSILRAVQTTIAAISFARIRSLPANLASSSLCCLVTRPYVCCRRISPLESPPSLRLRKFLPLAAQTFLTVGTDAMLGVKRPAHGRQEMFTPTTGFGERLASHQCVPRSARWLTSNITERDSRGFCSFRLE